MTGGLLEWLPRFEFGEPSVAPEALRAIGQ
jgi:hypothetical protein